MFQQLDAIRQLRDGRLQVISEVFQSGKLVEVLGATQEPLRHDEIVKAAHVHLHPTDAHRLGTGPERGVSGLEAAGAKDDVSVLP